MIFQEHFISSFSAHARSEANNRGLLEVNACMHNHAIARWRPDFTISPQTRTRAHRCSLKFSAVREEQKDKYSPEEREACVAVICAISNDGRMRRQRKGKEIGCWPSAT